MDILRESDPVAGQHSPSPLALYQQFFDHAPYGFFIAQPDTAGTIRFPLINDYATRLFGAQMHAAQTDYAVGLQSVIGTLSEADNQAQSLEREDRLLLEGRELHVKTRLTPVRGEEGALLSVIGVIDDISAQKSREHLQALREAKFRSIAEHIGIGIVRFDVHCRRVYVNPYVAQAYNLASDEIIGKTPRELPGGKSGEQYEALIREVFLTGRYAEYSHEVTNGGRNRLCRMMLFPEWLPSGEVGSVLSIGQRHDDSHEELKLSQEYPSPSRAPFSVISADRLFCFDRSGACSYVDQAADMLLQEFGQTAAALSDPSLQPDHPFVTAIRAAVRQALDTGELLEKELAWSAANGHPYHFRIRCQPNRSGHGEVASVFASVSKLDRIESRTRGYSQNPAVQHEIVREDERRRIALEIHDELGQLLTALRFRVAMLKPQLEASNRLVEMGMQEILDIIDRGSREVRRITTNARPMLLGKGLRAAIADLIHDFSSYTGIDFELDIEEREIPLDDERATAVFRIVQESITNIARHSGARKAWLTLRRKLDRYHLRIADNGNGFDLSAPRKRSLGLAGIRERVMFLNGEIFIQSKPGQGTSIQVSVPAAAL